MEGPNRSICLQARTRRRDPGRASDLQDRGAELESGDTIRLGRGTALRVLDVRDDAADQPPTLVVEDTSPTGHS
jgi:hypothetical protein